MRIVNPALLTLPNFISIGMMLLFLFTLIWAAASFSDTPAADQAAS